MARLTLSEAEKLFLQYQEYRKNASRPTLLTYSSCLESFIKFVGDIPLETLTIKNIDDYAESLSHMGYKDKTYRNKLVVVRSMIRFLYSKELSIIRPESIELPKLRETEANFLNFDEQFILIHSTKDLRSRAIIKTLLRSGLRISELIDLKTDDVCERSLVVRHGKGGKARVTFITEACDKAIEDYLATKGYTTYLFTNHAGQRLSRQYVTRIISEAGVKAGLRKHISPHTLRHSFATNMLREGARAEDIQPLMGHVNIATTRMYMHFTNPYLKERYDAITKGDNFHA